MGAMAVPAMASAASVGYQTSAWGTKVSVAGNLTSSQTARTTVACTTQPGVQDDSSAASVSVPGVLSTGTATSQSQSLASGDTATSRSTSTVSGISVAGGLITADAMTSVASTTYDPATGFSHSSTGTQFANLRVAGIPVNASPAPNTGIPGLLGITVLVNEQVQTARTLRVNAIHIRVDLPVNVLGLEAGTNIVIGHAKSRLSDPIVAMVGGAAYGTQVRSSLISSGQTALVGPSCLGTAGDVKSKNVAGLSLPGVLTTGAIATTAEGDADADSSEVNTTTSVAGINLLSGLLNVDAINAQAHATRTGDTVTLDDAGSSITGLSVAGFPELGDDVPENTRVTIAGLGTLWLHRVIRRDGLIEVRMVELEVLQSNDLGLPVGADVRIGVARAVV